MENKTIDIEPRAAVEMQTYDENLYISCNCYG